MNEWVQSQTRSRHTPCLFGKHPRAPAQENQKPAANEKEFLSCQSNSETTNWPKAENLGQIER